MQPFIRAGDLVIDKQYLQCHFFSQAEDIVKEKKEKTEKKKEPVRRTYKISEAARSLKVPTSTLRYWETVFPEQLHPVRSRGGQRSYTEEDMAALRRIHDLLHTHRMTIEGALKVLKGGQPAADAMLAGEGQETVPEGHDGALLAGILQELKAIRDVLAPRPEGEART
ncbi:MAG: MerR family transcriptional regulator [Mailhella sp.]|nr:MerR family transcriptional regulator [Mailhella sp.]